MELNKQEKIVIKKAKENTENWYWNKWLYFSLCVVFSIYLYSSVFALEYSDEGYNKFGTALCVLWGTSLGYLFRNWSKPIKDSLLIRLIESKEKQKNNANKSFGVSQTRSKVSLHSLSTSAAPSGR